MLIIGRITDGVAVLEDDGGDLTPIPASLLPQEAKEGDVIRAENGLYVLLRDETDRRRNKINKLQRGLWE